LLERLGDGWVSQWVVITGGAKNGLPNHYKIDLANPQAMIAIEVDGKSHDHRKEQDARKDAFLRDKGWNVVRFTNQEVRSLTDELLEERRSQCPVDAEVMLEP
jgi:very-short-patch-repair endonuclease